MARRCPFCYEKIHKMATICPHCHSKLDKVEGPSQERASSEAGIGPCTALAMGVMGVATGILAVLLLGFINERRKWEGSEEAEE